MRVYSGISADEGEAYGVIRIKEYSDLVRDNYATLGTEYAADAEYECSLFLRARVYADKELKGLATIMERRAQKKEAEIFHALRMLAMDETFAGSVLHEIRDNGKSAVYSIGKVSDELANRLMANASDLFRSRCEDIYDLRDLLIKGVYQGGSVNEIEEIGENCILVTDTISPVEVMRLNTKWVNGIVCRKGSIYSHSAILAAARNIPMLINCNIEGVVGVEGYPAILSADKGKLYVSPDDEVIAEFEDLRKRRSKEQRILDRWEKKGYQPEDLLLNASTPEDVDTVIKYNMKGIGVFRTEFMFMGDTTAPTEDNTYAFASEMAKRLKDKVIVIRTMDFAEDKHPQYVNDLDGKRGIEYSLYEETMFRSQLRTVLRSSVFTQVSVLLPMIRKVEEFKRTLEIIEELKVELKNEGLDYSDNYRVGAMIETPEAIECVDELAKLADFFSIGSNDLGLYALGISRDNTNKNSFSAEERKKMLELIKKACDAAHREGIRVEICGKIGNDPDWTDDLKAAGIDTFSISL